MRRWSPLTSVGTTDPFGFDTPAESAESVGTADPFAVEAPVESADPFGSDAPVEQADAAAPDGDPFGFGFFEAAPTQDQSPSQAAPSDGGAVPRSEQAELTEPDRTAPEADPWSGFFDEPDTAVSSPGAEDQPMPEPSAVLPSELPPTTPPPPAPTTAPVQADWVPTEPVAAFLDPAVDPSTPPDPAGEPAPEPGAGPLSPSRVGGLTRRVPGASLAESRGAEVGAVATPAAARSADGVRSMLSSFQSGRRRGRGDGAAAPAPDLQPSPGEPFAGDPPTDGVPPGTSSPAHNSVPDGRFPQ